MQNSARIKKIIIKRFFQDTENKSFAFISSRPVLQPLPSVSQSATHIPNNTFHYALSITLKQPRSMDFCLNFVRKSPDVPVCQVCEVDGVVPCRAVLYWPWAGRRTRPAAARPPSLRWCWPPTVEPAPHAAAAQRPAHTAHSVSQEKKHTHINYVHFSVYTRKTTCGEG